MGSKAGRKMGNKMGSKHAQGLTLLELMIALAVLGILSIIAVPIFNKYGDTARMTKANHHYQQAIKLVRTKQVENSTAISMGAPSLAPESSEKWIEAFGTSDEAPGGGPAYIPNLLGDSLTGAIGIESLPDGRFSVAVTRPAYLSLEAFQATVNGGKVVETKI